jgi:hypothetical protein
VFEYRERASYWRQRGARGALVALYLLPELNVRLLPQLERLKRGARIVSRDFDIAGVVPAKELALRPDPQGSRHDIYLFETPLQRK